MDMYYNNIKQQQWIIFVNIQLGGSETPLNLNLFNSEYFHHRISFESYEKLLRFYETHHWIHYSEPRTKTWKRGRLNLRSWINFLNPTLLIFMHHPNDKKNNTTSLEPRLKRKKKSSFLGAFELNNVQLGRGF